MFTGPGCGARHRRGGRRDRRRRPRCGCARALARRDRRGRLGRGQRRLPHGDGGRRRRASPPTSCTRRCARSLAGRARRRARRSTSSCALRAADRLGGHIVQGHVDGVGTVARRARGRLRRVVTIDAEPELLRYVVEKGSIAVDGVWLTVARGRRRRLRGLADPGDAASARRWARPAPGTRGQPRGGRAGEVRREAGRGTRMSAEHPRDAVRHRRGGDRGHPRRARWSSSATTRTARTRATSRWRPSSRRPRRSTSWPREGRGLICLALTPERCDELGLDLMAAQERVARFETAFTRLDRGARGRHDRHLGARPRAHDPGRDRPGHDGRATSSSPATCSR